jgi:hypothetical protein
MVTPASRFRSIFSVYKYKLVVFRVDVEGDFIQHTALRRSSLSHAEISNLCESKPNPQNPNYPIPSPSPSLRPSVPSDPHTPR